MSRPFLSYSQISTWQRCRWAWHLSYERNLAPRVDKRPPSLGSAVHAGIAAAIWAHHLLQVPDDPFITSVLAVQDHPNTATTVSAMERAIQRWQDKYVEDRELFDEEIDAVNELTETATAIATRTIHHLNLDEWETLTVNGVPIIEYHFVVPLNGWGGLQGYIDWAARHKPTGHSWLVDWKVRESFQPLDAEEVNLQMATYQRALSRLHGLNFSGSIQFQIANRTPSQPKLNKDGSMSRALIKTTWDTYRAALVEARLNPDDYLDMADKLSTIEFFRLSQAYRSPQEVQAIWKEVIQPAAWDLSRKKKHLTRDMSQRTCNGCDFRPLCLGALRGDDVLYMLQHDYRPKASNDRARDEKGDEEEVAAV